MKNKTINSLSFMITAVLLAATPLIASATTITRQMSVGVSGADVSSIQKFLSHDERLYPTGTVNGHFGPATKVAIENFQTYNNLPKTGAVDAATLPVLNEKMVLDGNGGPNATISNVAVLPQDTSAFISFDTNEAAQGLVYFSTKPLAITEHWNSVDVIANMVSLDKDFHYSQGIAIRNLQPNTMYFYMVQVTDKDNNVSVTLPAAFITAPNAN